MAKDTLGSIFTFYKSHMTLRKMQKSYQANAQLHDNEETTRR